MLGGRRRQFRTRSSCHLTHFCLFGVRAAAVVHDGLVALRYKTVECCGACIAVLSSLGLRTGQLAATSRMPVGGSGATWCKCNGEVYAVRPWLRARWPCVGVEDEPSVFVQAFIGNGGLFCRFWSTEGGVDSWPPRVDRQLSLLRPRTAPHASMLSGVAVLFPWPSPLLVQFCRG